jgi:hypothetical protein
VDNGSSGGDHWVLLTPYGQHVACVFRKDRTISLLSCYDGKAWSKPEPAAQKLFNRWAARSDWAAASLSRPVKLDIGSGVHDRGGFHDRNGQLAGLIGVAQLAALARQLEAMVADVAKAGNLAPCIPMFTDSGGAEYMANPEWSCPGDGLIHLSRYLPLLPEGLRKDALAWG